MVGGVYTTRRLYESAAALGRLRITVLHEKCLDGCLSPVYKQLSVLASTCKVSLRN